MMTSSNRNISTLLAFCAWNSPMTGEFPAQTPVTRSFDVFFDLRLNRQLRKQWRRWWFETLSPSLWRHCKDCFSDLFYRIYINNMKTVSLNPARHCVEAWVWIETMVWQQMTLYAGTLALAVKCYLIFTCSMLHDAVPLMQMQSIWITPVYWGPCIW